MVASMSDDTNDASPSSGSLESLEQDVAHLRKEFAEEQTKRVRNDWAALEALFESALPAAISHCNRPTSLDIPAVASSKQGAARGIPKGGASGTAKIRIDHRPMASSSHGTGARVGKEEWTLFATVPLPSAQPVPEYVSWCYRRHNELARDCGRRMFYTDDKGETVPVSDDDDAPTEENGLFGCNSAREEWVVQRILSKHGSSPELVAALADRLGVGQGQLQTYLNHTRPHSMPCATARWIDGWDSAKAPFERYFCRRCRSYNCAVHSGQHHVKPFQKPPAWNPGPTRPCGPDCFRSNAERRPLSAPSRPRPAAPAAAAAVSREAATPAAGALLTSPSSRRPESHAGEDNVHRAQDEAGCAALDAELLLRLAPLFSNDACALSQLLGPPWRCCDVHAQLQGLQGGRMAGAAVRAPSSRGRRSRSKRLTGSSGTMRKRCSHVIRKRLLHSQDEAWPEYTPCSCTDGCKAECPCSLNKNFCEKFCACRGRCGNAHKGCSCKSGCRSNTCPCRAAGRECDPDLCLKCCAVLSPFQRSAQPTGDGRGSGASDGSGGTTTSSLDDASHAPAGSAAAGGDAPSGAGAPAPHRCLNMPLRMRQQKRLAMGLSQVSGWGAFLREPAAKNELLGEYTGDLIPQEEADRRGKVYDMQDCSYLFNLNEQWVLDARQAGNKLRFANHSDKPNCYARIMLVDGDHHVGVFASQDLAAGQELFYNYRYDREQAPAWAQSRQGLSRRGRRPGRHARNHAWRKDCREWPGGRGDGGGAAADLSSDPSSLQPGPPGSATARPSTLSDDGLADSDDPGSGRGAGFSAHDPAIPGHREEADS